MNCEKIKKNIEEYVYELDIKLGQDAEKHFKECTSCRQYYEDLLDESKLLRTLRENEPELSDPKSLTNDIILAISEQSGKSQPSKVISIVVKLLAAASVCLFIVFGVEQYFVLEKIQKLEISQMETKKNTSHFAIQLLAFSIRDAQITNFLELEKNFRKNELSAFRKKAMVANMSNSELNKLSQYKHLITEEQLRSFHFVKQIN